MHEGKPGKESISQDLCVGIISNVNYEKDEKKQSCYEGLQDEPKQSGTVKKMFIWVDLVSDQCKIHS